MQYVPEVASINFDYCILGILHKQYQIYLKEQYQLYLIKKLYLISTAWSHSPIYFQHVRCSNLYTLPVGAAFPTDSIWFPLPWGLVTLVDAWPPVLPKTQYFNMKYIIKHKVLQFGILALFESLPLRNWWWYINNY